jgi:hypothetical protein
MEARDVFLRNLQEYGLWTPPTAYDYMRARQLQNVAQGGLVPP